MHQDFDLALRLVRDLFSAEFSLLWVDSEATYERIVEFLDQVQPQLVPRVKLDREERGLFERFGIEKEIEAALKPKVWLKSGGYLVINPTEALVAIDVNTGRFVGQHNLEETALAANLEAVEEAVRQIRLRDLGGIIVLDLIDMTDPAHREQVSHALELELRKDRGKHKVLSISEFGLVQITRKRSRSNLERLLTQTCPYCEGSGRIKSVATICLSLRRSALAHARDARLEGAPAAGPPGSRAHAPARGARHPRGARARARGRASSCRVTPSSITRASTSSKCDLSSLRPPELRYPRSVTSIPFAWPGFRGEASPRLAGEDLPAVARRLLDPACGHRDAALGAQLHLPRHARDGRGRDRGGGEAVPGAQPPGPAPARARTVEGGEELPHGVGLRGRGALDPRAALLRRGDGRRPDRDLRHRLPRGAPRAALPAARQERRHRPRELSPDRRPRRRSPRWRATPGGCTTPASSTATSRSATSCSSKGATADEIADVAVLDLNRCRRQRRVATRDRMRDLCRLPLERPGDREALLAAYFAPDAVPAAARRSYELARRSFLGKNRAKSGLRGALARVKSWLVPRGVHAHIPPPPEDAPVRDRAVWDRLSDQPHQHAGRLARARIRLADLPKHLRAGAALAGALPRIRRRYRELAAQDAERARAPFAWPEPGVALRPWPENPEALLAAFDRLGARRAMIRLHPWQASHDEEWELARALAGRGVELAFTLPQNRELVRDPARWEAAITEIAERFVPLGRRFQIGQAINRSKWGIWNYDEYLELAARAAGILRGTAAGSGAEVELFGPAVIDFEAHVTAAVVNLRAPRDLPALRFDGLASLLYVDRRGAPENRQLGFDTDGKVRLLAAIAGTARRVAAPRQWISEVNWPLREGPHSPAGKSVAVDEEAQADFLVRFFLLAGGSGRVERIDWWQLVAKGYGLCDPQADGTLRERPSFARAGDADPGARRNDLSRSPAGGRPAAGRARLPLLPRRVGTRPAQEIVVAWSTAGALDWTPPGGAAAHRRSRRQGAAARGGVAAACCRPRAISPSRPADRAPSAPRPWSASAPDQSEGQRAASAGGRWTDEGPSRYRPGSSARESLARSCRRRPRRREAPAPHAGRADHRLRSQEVRDAAEDRRRDPRAARLPERRPAAGRRERSRDAGGAHPRRQLQGAHPPRGPHRRSRRGVMGAAVRERRTQVVNDVAADPRYVQPPSGLAVRGRARGADPARRQAARAWSTSRATGRSPRSTCSCWSSSPTPSRWRSRTPVSSRRSAASRSSRSASAWRATSTTRSPSCCSARRCSRSRSPACCARASTRRRRSSNA